MKMNGHGCLLMYSVIADWLAEDKAVKEADTRTNNQTAKQPNKQDPH
jgi:hypothetical protein